MGWEKNYNSSPVYEWMKSVPWLPVRPPLRDLDVCAPYYYDLVIHTKK